MSKASVAPSSAKIWLRLGALALLGSATLLAATPQAGAVSQKVKNACRSDYQQFCPQYEPDTAQARSCMQQAGKRRSLSPRCYSALADAGMVPRRYLKPKK